MPIPVFSKSHTVLILKVSRSDTINLKTYYQNEKSLLFILCLQCLYNVYKTFPNKKTTLILTNLSVSLTFCQTICKI